MLIPIIERDHEISVLLTQRTDFLPHHAGQISFPGGKIEANDSTAQMTALRETKEETGLEDITLLSQLGTFCSYSGFEITTIVGLVNQPLQLQPNPNEVASLIEVPLSIIMDAQQYEQDEFHHDNQHRIFYRLNYQDNNIWGFTGTILYLFGQYLAQLTE